MIRAKFQCNSVERFVGGEKVSLNAVYGKDGSANASWSKATPYGSLSMTISNPEACGKFEPGKEYFIDFSPAE